LFKDHGWPSRFNKTSFEIARQEWIQHEHKRWPIGFKVLNLRRFEERYARCVKNVAGTKKYFDLNVQNDGLEDAEERIRGAEKFAAWAKDDVEKAQNSIAKEDQVLVEETINIADAGFGLEFALHNSWYTEYEVRENCTHEIWCSRGNCRCK
jgi:hypothetical protein